MIAPCMLVPSLPYLKVKGEFVLKLSIVGTLSTYLQFVAESYNSCFSTIALVAEYSLSRVSVFVCFIQLLIFTYESLRARL